MTTISAVGSALPRHAAVPKGWGVHPSKSHVSWEKIKNLGFSAIKYVARQYGLYLLEV